LSAKTQIAQQSAAISAIVKGSIGVDRNVTTKKGCEIGVDDRVMTKEVRQKIREKFLSFGGGLI